MSLNAILARHGADKPRLQERAPLIDQAAVAAIIVLGGQRAEVRSAHSSPGLTEPGLGVERGSVGSAVPTRQIRLTRAYTAGLCGASTDHSRKKK